MESGKERRRPRMGTFFLESSARGLVSPKITDSTRSRLMLDGGSSLGLLRSDDLAAAAAAEDSWLKGKENDPSASAQMPNELPSRYLKPSSEACELDWSKVLSARSFLEFQDSSSSFAHGPVSARSTSVSDSPEFVSASQSFINREEKEFELRQHELPTEDLSHFSISDRDSTLSKSQYFLLGTSKMGSLEKDADPRPDFGFMSVRSPPRRPRKLVAKRAENSVASFLPSFIEESPDKSTKFKKPPPNRFRSSVRHSSPLKPAAAAKPQFMFPISSDKEAMFWCGVDPGQNQEQFVTLKNSWDKEVKVSITVRDSREFALPLTVVALPPNSTKPVFVSFNPGGDDRRCGVWISGKLVIKPQSLGIGKALKATIKLHGFVGASNIRFGNGVVRIDGKRASLNVGRLPNDVCKVQRLSVFNDGSAAGFVSVDGLRVEPSRFVVDAGGRQDVVLRIDPLDVEGPTIGRLVVTFGHESARRVLKAVGVDSDVVSDAFAGEGEGQGDVFGFQVGNSGNTLQSCLDELDRLEVEVLGKKAAPSDFNVLSYEETLSETRLEQPPPKPTKSKKGEVRLDPSSVIFPPAKPNQSVVAKITIKNPKLEPVTLVVSSLQPPFYNNHQTVTVKGKYFQSLPLVYRPPSAGKHDATLRMKTPDGSHVLVATLKGSTY